MTTPDFGTDIGAVLDLDPSFRLVSGYRCLGEALARRIVTQRSSLIDDRGYGTDVRARLNDNLTPAQLFALEVGVINEWRQDERVEDVSVKATLTVAGTLKIAGRVVTAEGPFALVLEVTALTVSLLSVEPTQ